MPTRARLERVFKFLVFYSAALASSIWLAYGLRYDFSIPPEQREYIPSVMAAVIPVELLALYAFHQFHLLPAYFGIPALLRMGKAMFVSTLILGFVRWEFKLGHALPFGVICLNFVLSLAILSFMCYTWRLYRHGYLLPMLGLSNFRSRPKCVAIVGAGTTGMNVAQEFLNHPERGYTVAAFFDDDRTKWNSRILEIPILGPPEMLNRSLAHSFEISEVVICQPEATRQRIRQIIESLRFAGIPVKTIPSLIELASGSYSVSNVRTIEIQDLLGREPVQLDTGEIRQLIRGKRVMVSGAGGSIGSELCRQVASYAPSQLMLVERSEVQLFAIERELEAREQGAIIQPLVADILDQRRMRQIFTETAPEIIFHAAAHKHVPMMERQPCEAIRNNVFGTESIAKLAVEFGVNHFVNVSTDKAINPTSVMGCTKRLAEMVILDINARNPGKTRFVCVRFGNVLGSSGSVVPLFKRQIANGGPVTVTHEEMKRYFMTIPEAVGLVLQTTVLAEGGEIFVLDMGEPVKIVELAKDMIRLSGLRPEDIEITFSGIRPGEKLFEELRFTDEELLLTTHPKIQVAYHRPFEGPLPSKYLRELRSLLGSDESLVGKLQALVPEYRRSGLKAHQIVRRDEHVVPT